MRPLSVVVIGAGVGGLAAAIRLGAAGHSVTVLERNDAVGGKLASYTRDGFSFETGPSLLTLPSVFDDLLALAGTSLAATCGPLRLDPSFAYRFADGTGFRARSSLGATVAAVEDLAPGSGARWQAFHDHGRRVWQVSQRTFFAGAMESPVALARRMRSPADLLAIDPLPTLAHRASTAFGDPRLRQWAGRYATYAGSSPYRAPATLSCIPYIEQAFGCWYLRGGLPTLAGALCDAATSLGVVVRTGCDVVAIRTHEQGAQPSGNATGAPQQAAAPPRGPAQRARTRSGRGVMARAGVGAVAAGAGMGAVAARARACWVVASARGRAVTASGGVSGVVLADGEVLAADVVVSDADAHHLYADLLADPRRLRRVRRAGQSSSGFVLLAAVEGATPGMAHHNVSFSADYRHEFAQIFDEAVPPSDPTIYVAVSSVTDPAQAPPGTENWSVLVNVPSGHHLDWSCLGPPYAEQVLAVMARRGWDLEGRLRWYETITPAEIESRYRAVGGAIYGSSSNGRRSAFLRAANRGPVPGLYLVGGSAHPGGGLPIVAMGGAIVADMVADDVASGWGQR